ncbi:tail fiber domain-containing protein [Bacteroidota bacterium]
MKRSLLTLIVILTVNALIAQVPQGFNFQGVARDSDGALLTNESISVRIGILNGTELVYQEDHMSVSTSQLGLFSLIIGSDNATNQSGSAASFSEIPWGTGTLSIQVFVDPANGSSFTDMGTSPLMSVPYALYAGNQGQGQAGNWQMNGDTLFTSGSVGIGTSTPNQSLLSIQSPDPQTEKPLFEVKNDLGNPVFAVYNNGVMVYVDESKKGVKGGFAVGGYNASKAGEVQDYFRITPDSARIYVREDPLAKGVKGGFAVGGYNVSKSGAQDLLYISLDSSRIYVSEDENSKGVKGGFAVGGYNTTNKGLSRDFLRVTPDSTRIYIDETNNGKGVKGGFAVGGYNTASKADSRNFLEVNNSETNIYYDVASSKAKGVKGGFAVGGYNTANKATSDPTQLTSLTELNYLIGKDAGVNITSGINNTFFGWESGISNTEGSENIFIGKESGYSNLSGNYNSFIGYQAGYSTNSDFNTFLGYNAGKYNSGGQNNIAIGFQAGMGNESGEGVMGDNNIFIGNTAGALTTYGDKNVFIGDSTGYSNTLGRNNVVMGYHAGFSNNQGFENVMIGTNAGYFNYGLGDTWDGNYNVFIGYNSGYYNTSGSGNVFLGYYSGWYSETGDYQTTIGHAAGAYAEGQWNTFIGAEAGIEATSGEENTYIGIYAGSYASGWYNTYLGMSAGNYAEGDDNTLIGAYAGYGNSESNFYYNTYVGSSAGENTTTGSSNTLLGYYTGYSLTTGSGNVFVGHEAGFNETGDNKLYISNSSTDNPLVYGDFLSEKLTINGNMGINFDGFEGYGLVIDLPSSQTPYYYLYTFGDVYTDGDYYSYTGNPVQWDPAAKSGSSTIDGALNKIKSINSFYYQSTAKSGESKNKIGVSADDVEKVLPELVKENKDGLKGVNYDGLIPVMIEAIKDQQAQIEAQQAQIEALKKLLEQK